MNLTKTEQKALFKQVVREIMKEEKDKEFEKKNKLKLEAQKKVDMEPFKKFLNLADELSDIEFDLSGHSDFNFIHQIILIINSKTN